VASRNEQPPTIAVVEDHAEQRKLIVEYLVRQGMKATGYADGAQFRRSADRAPPDLVLLDLRLPGEDGFAIARRLRDAYPRMGIIMVTGSSDTVDRVVGLETGADDYIAKPFDPRELLARVKSVLRRARGEPATMATVNGAVRVGARLFDPVRRVLIEANGDTEPLTGADYDLLKLLVEHPNRALSRDWIFESLSNREAGSSARSIDQRVNRLRRKIEEDPDHPEIVRTVRGVGYMFVPART
jgi:DNA-binding response OmpR family regulator